MNCALLSRGVVDRSKRIFSEAENYNIIIIIIIILYTVKKQITFKKQVKLQ